MKKLVVILFIVCMAFQLTAEFDFYGSIRLGWWYKMSDEDYTGGESRFEFEEPFYKDSRLGVNYKKEDFRANVEMGLVETNVSVREATFEYDFGGFKLLVGRTMTGFADYASQAYDTDRVLRGYGMMWDNYNNQIRLTLKCGGYLILAEPVKTDPAALGTNNIDALIPKINVGKKFNLGALYFHPTLGVNMYNYNEDFAVVDTTTFDTIDESVLSYIFATTFKYDMKPFCFKLQASYGQNTGDYGMKRAIRGSQGFAKWDGSEIIDATVMAGYFEAKYNSLALGLGYIGDDKDTLNDTDAAASAYLQYKFNITKNICLIPEAGILDHMEDGMGNKEGSITYFGTEIRATF